MNNEEYINDFKILRPFTGTGGIFFPIGLPPKGTCEFSTKECRKHCYVNNKSLFDIEAHIPQGEKQVIYDFIINEPINTIVNRFLKELDGLQTPILHWFGSGDCMTKDIDKILQIIKAMPKGIVQMGFTRNIKLWKQHKNIFALTIDDIEYMKNKSGMFSKPEYIKERSIMCTSSYVVKGGYCGPDICKDPIDTTLDHFIDCKICLVLKCGCFDKSYK
jgi:hypothetical protein